METPTDATPETTVEYPTIKDVITATLTQADVDDFNAAQATEPEPDANLEYARKLNRLVIERRRLHEEAAEEAKARKKLLEKAQEGLNDFLASLDEEMPLFDQKPAPADTDADDDDSWRVEPTAQLISHGLSESSYQALESAGLLTMGDLADWTRDGNRRPEDIPGIGPAKAEQLSDALGDFYGAYFARQRQAIQDTVDELAASLPGKAPGSPQDATTDPRTTNLPSDDGGSRHEPSSGLPGDAVQIHTPDPGPVAIEPKKSRKRKAG